MLVPLSLHDRVIADVRGISRRDAQQTKIGTLTHSSRDHHVEK